MAKTIQFNSDIRNEYEDLFNSCEINAQNTISVNRLADRIIAKQDIYKSLAAVSGVPWFVIAAIHNMEASMRFDRHLHNGDKLTAKTHNVPKNRPSGNPPFTWEESALDAIRFDNLNGWKNWSLAGTLFKLEGFNGFGYRRFHSQVFTPYLWSFSNHYQSGKYASDGKFDPDLVSKQCGIAAIFKVLEARGKINFNEPLEASVLARDMPPAYPGRVLIKGLSDNENVHVIQVRLNQLGASVPALEEDGDFDNLTEAAVRMFQARSEDSMGEPLEIDGKVGALTWESLFGRVTFPRLTERSTQSPLLEKVLSVAKNEIGVMEEPLGSNKGQRIEQYLASTDLGGGYAWCAAFIHFCFQEAAKELGTDNPCIKTAGVLSHWNKAGQHGIRRITHEQVTNDPQLVQPGMIFIIDTGDPGGAGHTGIVERVQGGRLVSIEGNTNNGGSREGIGVFRRTKRKINSINKGFIDYSRGLG